MDTTPIVELRDRPDDITALKFSPDGHVLAVASAGRAIDIYAAREAVVPAAAADESESEDGRVGDAQAVVWERVSVCVGHSAAVTALDFSDDACLLRSNDAAGEVLLPPLQASPHGFTFNCIALFSCGCVGGRAFSFSLNRLTFSLGSPLGRRRRPRAQYHAARRVRPNAHHVPRSGRPRPPRGRG